MSKSSSLEVLIPISKIEIVRLKISILITLCHPPFKISFIKNQMAKENGLATNQILQTRSSWSLLDCRSTNDPNGFYFEMVPGLPYLVSSQPIETIWCQVEVQQLFLSEYKSTSTLLKMADLNILVSTFSCHTLLSIRYKFRRKSVWKNKQMFPNYGALRGV